MVCVTCWMRKAIEKFGRRAENGKVKERGKEVYWFGNGPAVDDTVQKQSQNDRRWMHIKIIQCCAYISNNKKYSELTDRKTTSMVKLLRWRLKMFRDAINLGPRYLYITRKKNWLSTTKP